MATSDCRKNESSSPFCSKIFKCVGRSLDAFGWVRRARHSWLGEWLVSRERLSATMFSSPVTWSGVTETLLLRRALANALLTMSCAGWRCGLKLFLCCQERALVESVSAKTRNFEFEIARINEISLCRV